MTHMFSPRRIGVAITLFGAVLINAAPAAAQAQSRFRVLVPDFIDAKGESTRNGGRIADQVRKLINEMPTHAPTEEKAIKDGLKKFGLKEKDMDCVKWRQLASQTGAAALVLCGTYDEATGSVTANFHPAGGGDAFEVAAFPFQSPEQTAQQVVQKFQAYTKQISLVAFCNEYITSQNWQQALDLCTQALEINPRSVMANLARGAALSNLDRNEEALAAFEAVLKLEQINQDALLGAGVVASKLGRTDLSSKYFADYLELNPGDTGVRLTIATRLSDEGDPAGALRVLEEVTSQPDAPASMLEYAGHFAMQAAAAAQRGGPANGNTDQATPFFERAIVNYQTAVNMKGDSADAVVLRNLMLAYRSVGNVDSALTVGARVTNGSEDGQAWFFYADVLNEAGRRQEAIAALDRAAALDTAIAGIAFRKAVLQFEDDQLDAAVATAKAGIAANDVSADQAEMLAQQIAHRGYSQHTEAGRFESAVRYFAAAREIGKSGRTIGMINFFHGYTVFKQADSLLRGETTTAESAKRAMPMLERAKVLLEAAKDYPEQAATVASLLQAVQQYVERAQALIRAGD